VALINGFKSLGARLERIGLEAGPLSQWLYGALQESGLLVELLETRHVKAALSAMPVKTDRNERASVLRTAMEKAAEQALRPLGCGRLGQWRPDGFETCSSAPPSSLKKPVRDDSAKMQGRGKANTLCW
jgi:transposase